MGIEKEALLCSIKDICRVENDKIKIVCSNDDLTRGQKEALEVEVGEFSKLSWTSSIRLRRINAIVHKIYTGHSEPVKQRHQNLSPYMLEHLHKELDTML